jgi:hypothetical protein
MRLAYGLLLALAVTVGVAGSAMSAPQKYNPYTGGYDDGAGLDDKDRTLEDVNPKNSGVLEDETHPLTFYRPSVYFWCRAYDPQNAKVYYSGVVSKPYELYLDDDTRDFAAFLTSKFGIAPQGAACAEEGDVYEAGSEADKFRAYDQLHNLQVVNTDWVGGVGP